MKRTTLLLLVPVLSGLALAGCELAVDFDRTKIPGTGTDASTPVIPTDSGVIDEGDAATDTDAGDIDAATDTDAGDTDAATDTDAGQDADAGADAGDEDAGDAG